MEEQQQESQRDWAKILTYAFIGLNLVTMLGGTYFIYANSLGYEEPMTSEEEMYRELASYRDSLGTEPVVYTMEPVNTNLSGVPRRLIRVQINLEMMGDEGFEEVITLGAKARDSIVKIINQKDYDEIETVQGKLLLKTQIIGKVNGFLNRGVVQNVYFSDFVVQ